jgi:hypothetical protein
MITPTTSTDPLVEALATRLRLIGLHGPQPGFHLIDASLDDEHPAHEGMDAAVVGVAPGLAHRDRLRRTVAQCAGVEAMSVVRGGGVRGAVLVVHGDAAPCLTVTLAGENLKLLIFTALELPPDAACDDDPLESAEALGLLPPPQPANSRAVPAMTTRALMDWRGFTAISVRL